MNKKVLLVEDDLQMQSLIVDYLKDYGFIVTAFDNPKDVLEDFKKVAEIIVANRWDECLSDVADKVHTNDVFVRD